MRVVLIAIAMLPVLASHGVAEEFKATSQLAAVTVFPRGAEVKRTMQVEVPAGAHRVVVSDLPASADLDSIRVEGRAAGEMQIGTVDARRIEVLRQDSAAQRSERRRLEDLIEAENDKLAALQAEVETKHLQKRYVENLAALPSAGISAIAKTAQPREDWAGLLGLIATSMADIQRSLLRQKIKIRAAKRRIVDLQRQLASVAQDPERRTEVKISLTAAAAQTADLTVRYQVSEARWRPLYDARLDTGSRADPAELVLTRRAAISQSTGEVWTDVAVALSTARPSARSGAPAIHPIIVDFQQPPTPMASQGAQRSGTDGIASNVQGRTRLRFKDKRKARIAEREAAIEIAGFQAVFKVPGKVTVANTGDAKRVKIETIKLKPSLLARAVPKFDLRAYLHAKLSLPKGIAPILPGDVMLFRDQTFVGRGRMPLLAAGEDHELGFGVDDAVRIKYVKVAESRGETGIISSTRTDQRRFKITLQNLHEIPIAYSILDQRPEPVNEEIKVELVGRNKPTKQNVKDKRGVVAWEGNLAPDQEFNIDFGYMVSWPADKKVHYIR